MNNNISSIINSLQERHNEEIGLIYEQLDTILVKELPPKERFSFVDMFYDLLLNCNLDHLENLSYKLEYLNTVDGYFSKLVEFMSHISSLDALTEGKILKGVAERFGNFTKLRTILIEAGIEERRKVEPLAKPDLL